MPRKKVGPLVVDELSRKSWGCFSRATHRHRSQPDLEEIYRDMPSLINMQTPLSS